jgi:hypothetical protein
MFLKTAEECYVQGLGMELFWKFTSGTLTSISFVSNFVMEMSIPKQITP